MMTVLKLLDYECHSVLHLWLHSEAKKSRQGGKQWKKDKIENLTSAEGDEGSTENCVSVSKELLHDSRP